MACYFVLFVCCCCLFLFYQTKFAAFLNFYWLTNIIFSCLAGRTPLTSPDRCKGRQSHLGPFAFFSSLLSLLLLPLASLAARLVASRLQAKDINSGVVLGILGWNWGTGWGKGKREIWKGKMWCASDLWPQRAIKPKPSAMEQERRREKWGLNKGQLKNSSIYCSSETELTGKRWVSSL